MTRQLLAVLACAATLAACGKGDSRADSVRADTLVPAAAAQDTSVAAISSTPAAPAASTTPAAKRPAATKRSSPPGDIIGHDRAIQPDPAHTLPKSSIKPDTGDTSHLGYDRAIQPKRDKAHTLPTARPS